MVRPIARRRHIRENIAARGCFVLALFPIGLMGIIMGVLVARSWPLLQEKGLWNLITGRLWKPMAGEFGFLPFISGTMWVTISALLIAVPPSVFTAIFLAEYARPAMRALMKPMLDLLAAIPSVVYGVWGMVAIVPWVHNSLAPRLGATLGCMPIFRSENPTGFSVIAGAIVLAVMIAPFIIAVAYEVMHAVPDGLRYASYAVGATRWQTFRHAVLPHIFPGLVAAVVLGLSRALGETMAVLMVVGNVAQIPGSLFDAAYPLPALIANNYGEMMSIPLYDSALMSAAFILFVGVMCLNIISTLFLRTIRGRAL